MNGKTLIAYGCIVFGGCLGSAATNVGEINTIPLVRVDGSPPPFTISDGTGASAQIASGSLTTYSTRAECDYQIILSTGKKIPGTIACLEGVVQPILNGVQVKLNLGAAGAPQGEHAYDFVGSEKPCSCPKFCKCGTNRLLPTESTLNARIPESPLIRNYRFGLTPR